MTRLPWILWCPIVLFFFFLFRPATSIGRILRRKDHNIGYQRFREVGIKDWIHRKKNNDRVSKQGAGKEDEGFYDDQNQSYDSEMSQDDDVDNEDMDATDYLPYFDENTPSTQSNNNYNLQSETPDPDQIAQELSEQIDPSKTKAYTQVAAPPPGTPPLQVTHPLTPSSVMNSPVASSVPVTVLTMPQTNNNCCGDNSCCCSCERECEPHIDRKDQKSTTERHLKAQQNVEEKAAQEEQHDAEENEAIETPDDQDDEPPQKEEANEDEMEIND